jgi:hypothetical protein
MTVKRKPKEYECNQAERLTRHCEILERTSLILYGNGEPKNGLLFRFDKFMDDHVRVLQDLSDIKLTVNKAIEDSVKTQKMIEDFRSDEEQFEKGKAAILKLQQIEKKEKRDRIEAILKIIAVIISVVALGFTINSAFNKLIDGQKAIKADTKVTNEVLIPPGATRGIKSIVIDTDTTSTFK